MSLPFQLSKYLQNAVRPLRKTSLLHEHASRSSHIPVCRLHTRRQQKRSMHSSSKLARTSPKTITSDRSPASKEDTQTDFGSMNVLGNTPAPTTSIDACLSDGFHLDNGLKISGGSGCLLVAGETFSWRPWEAGSRGGGHGKGRLLNNKGQWDVEKEAWGVLELMWPKPGESAP
ncbi:MAG: hypothetical protein M1835_001312 [Candelina submexicana]|nr:MAG: hypothetical protein M1835_001312 [Candelina submexicana]